MELLNSPEFWAAIVGGGAAVKLLDYFLPFVFDRGGKRRAAARDKVKDSSTEREALRADIEYLRTEINLLRTEVEKLEERVGEKTREVSVWQQRYWEKRIQLDRVVIEVRHHGDEGIWGRVEEIMAKASAESVDGSD